MRSRRSVKYEIDRCIYRQLRRRRCVKLSATPLLLFIGGLYLIALLVAPQWQKATDPTDATKHDAIAYQALDANKVTYNANQLIIPKIGVKVDFAEGSAKVMDVGAWHRFPERGNPVDGGNFIVSAHRFNLGWTPQQTREKSPLYNINKVNTGDVIHVDYKGQRYTYEVKKRYIVKPDAAYIEDPSSSAKLTLYSCTLKGASDGREVVEAVLKSREIAALPNDNDLTKRAEL